MLALLKKQKKQKLLLPVIEIFSSLQGEGIYAGQKHLFLRFDKCNIACTYCDELHKDSSLWTVDAICRKISELQTLHGKHRFLSLTGGEPLLYTEGILALSEKIGNREMGFYLETNGNLPKRLEKVISVVDVVAMDIKLKSVSETENTFYENEIFLQTCLQNRKEVFVKIVVGSETSFKEFQEAVNIIKRSDERVPLILQPLTVSNGEDVPVDLLMELQSVASKKLNDVRVVPRFHEIFHIA